MKRLPVYIGTLVFLMGLLCMACSNPVNDTPQSNTKVITAFTFASPATTGVVTESTHSIALTVPFGTTVTALVPTITHTGASISPTSGTAQNFTAPVTYTVTAQDGSTQAYTVSVTTASIDSKFFFKAFIYPVAPIAVSGETSAFYSADIYIQDVDTPTLPITDAVVTVNGQSLAFNNTSSDGNYYSTASVGFFSVGDTIPIVITQSRVGTLTYNRQVPAIAAPTNWTVTPSIPATGVASTATSYSFSTTDPLPTSSISVWAHLYDNSYTYKKHVWDNNGTGHNIVPTPLTYGSGPTLAPYLKFIALSLTEYYPAGLAPKTRIKLFAPSGALIGQNF